MLSRDQDRSGEAGPPARPGTGAAASRRARLPSLRRALRAGFIEAQFTLLWAWFRVVGPPRMLVFRQEVNRRLLAAFGARVGDCRVLAPITFNSAWRGYRNLAIADGCVLAGNNHIDLDAPVTLAAGACLEPGVIVLTHAVSGTVSGASTGAGQDRPAGAPKRVGRGGVHVGSGAVVRAGAILLHGARIAPGTVVPPGAVVAAEDAGPTRGRTVAAEKVPDCTVNDL